MGRFDKRKQPIPEPKKRWDRDPFELPRTYAQDKNAEWRKGLLQAMYGKGPEIPPELEPNREFRQQMERNMDPRQQFEWRRMRMKELEDKLRRGLIDRSRFEWERQKILGMTPDVDAMSRSIQQQLDELVEETERKFRERNGIPPEQYAVDENMDPLATEVEVRLTLVDKWSNMRYEVGCRIPSRVWVEAMEVDREPFVRELIMKLGHEIAKTGGR